MTDLTIYPFNNIPRFKSPIFIIGAFESFHIGHHQLYEKAKELKQNNEHDIVLIYFKDVENLPKNINKFIFSNLQARLQTFANLNFEYAIELEYSKVKNYLAEEFINILTENNKDFKIIIGKDFHFGYQGQGNYEFLEQKFPNQIYSIDILKLQNSAKISSSFIKESLELGDIELVNTLLVMPYSFNANLDLEHNLSFKENLVMLPNGIYASTMQYNDYEYKCALLVKDQKYKIQILDFKYKNKDIQNVNIIVEKNIRFFADGEKQVIKKDDFIKIKKYYLDIK
ncbi:MAG: FAD synthase [Metamycoplasmataceae bacterium]